MTIGTINKLEQHDRTRLGQRREAEVASLIERNLPGSRMVQESSYADCVQKIDYRLEVNGKSQTVQVKTRDAGRPDIGVEVIRRLPVAQIRLRPAQYLEYARNERHVGRDMQTKADLYACCAQGRCFVLATRFLSRIVTDVLAEWRLDGRSIGQGVSFASARHAAELRYFPDQGLSVLDRGNKIVCYVDPDRLPKNRRWIFHL